MIHRTKTGALAEICTAVVHRDDEFNQFQLDVYAEIEAEHFWFRGRRRFLQHALAREMGRPAFTARHPSAIDLGGGSGGWISFLQNRMPGAFAELALGDSSPRALELAGNLLGPTVSRHHIDLRHLPWRDRWDIVFLLDVLEHLHDDVEVLRQIASAMRPGGMLFVTTPALESLWSYNDDLEQHVRRYSRRDFESLAHAIGLKLLDARYFMFLLSPLLIASRWFGPKAHRMNDEQKAAHYRKTHRVPWRPANSVLRAVFNLETPLGHWMRFPWGTSVLGVFQRRESVVGPSWPNATCCRIGSQKGGS